MEISLHKYLVITALLYPLMGCSQVLHPASINGIREFASHSNASLISHRTAGDLAGIKQQTLKFEADGLLQYALLQRPSGEAPAKGWPVIVFAHGFHPNPQDYGRRKSDGITDRPGDYYRAIPQAYARAGFAVLTPDYRGHNDSQGSTFTNKSLSRNWYSRDLISAIKTLSSLTGLNTENLFISGHSMGGAVAMNVLLALGKRVKGAAIWSGGLQDFHARAIDNEVQRALKNRRAADFSTVLQTVEKSFQQYDPSLEQSAAYFGNYLHLLETPVLIQHAIGDQSTAFSGSLELAKKLQKLDKSYVFYPYQSDNHLFMDNNFERAIERDVVFFRGLMAGQKRTRND